MLNRYPLWRYLLIIIISILGFLYAAPILYPDQLAIQVSSARTGIAMDKAAFDRGLAALKQQNIPVAADSFNDAKGLIRFNASDAQLKAQTALQQALGDSYVVALSKAPTTPKWLTTVGAKPMNLGLDLRGGVQFSIDVDIKQAVTQRLNSNASEIRNLLRQNNIRYRGVDLIQVPDSQARAIRVRFEDSAVRSQAQNLLNKNFADFDISQTAASQPGATTSYYLQLVMKPEAILEVENYAVNQSITTLRNRVNELGVAEPVVQREGKNRILVELPGVQDTTMAKRILGSTATLEFRLVSTDGQGETFHYRDDPNRTIRLQRQVIVTGNQVVGAISGIDPQTSGPEINVTLDSRGGSAMGRLTSQNVGRQMAVLYIEHRTKVEKRMIDGQQQEVPITKVEKGVISVATIQGQFASRFRITGLSSMAEASETALLLRSGALPAPIYIVGERVVGPSLGADNIRMGILSAEIGLLLVIVFMVVLYKLFGLIANLALLLNMVLVIAAMSLLGFTLTLPGIAGMVLTLGMAVDANVLIFSRIKEEMANGMPVQSAIDAGYKRAFVSILDSNLTTLLVAVILFAIGTGPIKGFAITLGIGLIFSMFTAITVTRAVVNLCFGGRQLKRLPI